MRLAFFGGSFDPPHRGHAAIAHAAADCFSLDRVLIAPTGQQPKKPLGATASYLDRLAMVSLMCAQDTRFQPCTLDAPRRNGPNYTVDTLEKLRTLHPASTQLYAIIGADSFLELPTWHRPSSLLSIAEWIVVSRPGFSLTPFEESGFLDKAESRVQLLAGVQERVSATELRDRLKNRENCSAFLFPAVAAYIQEQGLYT